MGNFWYPRHWALLHVGLGQVGEIVVGRLSWLASQHFTLVESLENPLPEELFTCFDVEHFAGTSLTTDMCQQMHEHSEALGACPVAGMNDHNVILRCGKSCRTPPYWPSVLLLSQRCAAFNEVEQKLAGDLRANRGSALFKEQLTQCTGNQSAENNTNRLSEIWPRISVSCTNQDLGYCSQSSLPFQDKSLSLYIYTYIAHRSQRRTKHIRKRNTPKNADKRLFRESAVSGVLRFRVLFVLL